MEDHDEHALGRMRERLAILDAMAAVIDRRQEFIELVAASADGDAARNELAARFGFTDAQAVAALDLQVRRFAARERRLIGQEAATIRNDLG